MSKKIALQKIYPAPQNYISPISLKNNPYICEKFQNP